MTQDLHERLAETWKKKGVADATLRACLSTPPACPVCHEAGYARVLGFDSANNTYTCGDGHSFQI